MTGHFTGWVEEGVRLRLGICASAAVRAATATPLQLRRLAAEPSAAPQEAWEAEGGGKFERAAPKGVSAKEFARSMLRKNPNAYFYRHNEPGQDTWQGEWAEEELQRFVQARCLARGLPWLA